MIVSEVNGYLKYRFIVSIKEDLIKTFIVWLKGKYIRNGKNDCVYKILG